MCNLYSLNKRRDVIARLFRVSQNRAEAYEPLSAIFPGHVAPVVRQCDDGERDLVLMNWGFVLLQDGRAPKRVTNVRDDTILKSKFWRGSFEERRCLVPATSFCEPNGDVKPATWNWFAINGDDPRPAFAFPGIWRKYHGPVRKDGPNVELEVYAFLTTTPNPLVATINHERMPVLLTREEEFETWLTGSPNEALELAREYPPGQMRIVQEGFYKEGPVRHRSVIGSAIASREAVVLRWLVLDLNSFFASCEQQENPELRDKPVIVVPVMAETTCAIAASYPAKAFGIKTGTLVHEARRLCRGLMLVRARHKRQQERSPRVC